MWYGLECAISFSVISEHGSQQHPLSVYCTVTWLVLGEIVEWFLIAFSTISSLELSSF